MTPWCLACDDALSVSSLDDADASKGDEENCHAFDLFFFVVVSWACMFQTVILRVMED